MAMVVCHYSMLAIIGISICQSMHSSARYSEIHMYQWRLTLSVTQTLICLPVVHLNTFWLPLNSHDISGNNTVIHNMVCKVYVPIECLHTIFAIFVSPDMCLNCSIPIGFKHLFNCTSNTKYTNGV